MNKLYRLNTYKWTPRNYPTYLVTTKYCFLQLATWLKHGYIFVALLLVFVATGILWSQVKYFKCCFFGMGGGKQLRQGKKARGYREIPLPALFLSWSQQEPPPSELEGGHRLCAQDSEYRGAAAGARKEPWAQQSGLGLNLPVLKSREATRLLGAATAAGSVLVVFPVFFVGWLLELCQKCVYFLWPRVPKNGQYHKVSVPRLKEGWRKRELSLGWSKTETHLLTTG